MNLRTVVAPLSEPVTLAQAKVFARVDDDDTDQDVWLELFVAAARASAENITRRAYVQRTLELSLPHFPAGGVIQVPKPPLQSVVSIEYTDLDGVTQTVDPAQYQVDTVREPGLIKPAYGCYWPSVRTSDFNPVRVRYVAGYAPAGSPADYTVNVPAELKSWIAVRLSTSNEFREAAVAGTIVTELPRSHVDGLLDGLIVNLF